MTFIPCKDCKCLLLCRFMELTVGAGPELSSQVLYVSFSPALRAVPLCACACGGSGSAGGGSGALPRPSAFPLPLFQGEDVPLKEPPPQARWQREGHDPPRCGICDLLPLSVMAPGSKFTDQLPPQRESGPKHFTTPLGTATGKCKWEVLLSS